MEHHKKVEHHIKKALEELKDVKTEVKRKPRSRSKSPARAERREKSPVRAERKERKVKEPKEVPAKIHVCREKSSGRYIKCKNPKK